MEFERGLLALAHVSLENSTLSEALTTIARITASTIDVNRVSVWQLDDDGARWRCIFAIDIATGNVSAGWQLEARKYPSYARALVEQRTVAVADTRNDPTSRELVADYFEPLHIGATLDVPIYRGGKVFGILCCELIDGVRDWSERERDFCTAVAELISRAFEQNDRIEAEKRLARAERSRHEAEKMEALGRMAAAVAHDFNNILGVIQLLTDTLARQDNDPAGRAHTLKLLREATDSGQRLTRKLMACARSDSITLTKVRLRTIVEGMRSMIESLVAPSRLVIDYSDDDDSILADPVGIEQILINLASNARDAIGPREGTVTIRVRRSRNFIELSVQDDGEGMDEHTRARIFEPFFSTRPNKSNAGLGMSTVFRIVEAHHARINVHSTLGQGTQIEVLFPVCASDETTQLQP